MKDKKMLGNTIYTLRKAKGLFQAQLGALVGVSNKAVSKWETNEANPDIALLPLIAEVFGITLDELLTDVRIKKEDTEPKKKKLFGVTGTETNSLETYEFVSDKKTKQGTPYLHVHFGKTLTAINTKAHGVVAIGNNAKGIISIGLFAKGIISLGLVSIGILAFGLIALGLGAYAFILAAGGAAAGGVAIGIVAWGGIAIGYIAYGGVAIGYYAYTGSGGLAIGIKKFFR